MSEVYFGPSDYADDDTPYEDDANMPLEPYDEEVLLEGLADHYLGQILSDESVSYTTVLLSLHSYLEAGVGLDSVEASTALTNMLDRRVLPNAQLYENDTDEACAQIKTALYTDIIPLYANLHDIDMFRRWLPSIMNVILQGHQATDGCLDDFDYDRAHCSKGYCPVKVVCLDVKQHLRRPDYKSPEYQYLPVDTAQVWIAKLDYLVGEGYLTEYENGRLYHQYSRRLKKGLKGFDLDESSNWF
jgi:hypothetical protein